MKLYVGLPHAKPFQKAVHIRCFANKLYIAGCLVSWKNNKLIYQEGNISKMPDFDVFSLLEIRKRKRRSHGKRQIGNDKRKRWAAQKSGTSLNNLSSKLREHGRHAMLSFLSSLPIPVLLILDIEANRFYDRNQQMYEAALLTRCYTQHALRPFIDAEFNHQRHFIQINFIKLRNGFYRFALYFSG